MVCPFYCRSFYPSLSPISPANVLGQNGYQFLPGGTIIQWGRVMANIGKSQTHSFPIAFPNGCTSIVGAINVGVIFPWPHLNIYVTGGYWVAKTQFYTYVKKDTQTNGQEAVHYIAIGY